MAAAIWQVRPAGDEDLPAIAGLIASVGGDLEALKAEQFVAVQDPAEGIIGCGRLKPYPGFHELASIAVKGQWRAAGVGRAIVRELLKSHTGPVYLICEDDVVDFFRRFGFDLIPMSEMLAGLRSKWERYAAQAAHLNVMRRD